jgi:hypothetical protein
MRGAAAAALALALLPAPAPPHRSEEEQARDALDALQQNLPAAVSEWVGKEGLWDLKYKGSVKSLRVTGPVEAKLTVRLEAFTYHPLVQGDMRRSRSSSPRPRGWTWASGSPSGRGYTAWRFGTSRGGPPSSPAASRPALTTP